MSPNEVTIDRVMAEFERAAHPIRLECRAEVIRRLPHYKPFWESCAADVAANFQPSRTELVRRLRGRVSLDRGMVAQTITSLVQESYKDYLVASGESVEVATIVATALVSIRADF